MSVTVVRSTGWQSVEKKLDISGGWMGGWVNVFDCGLV